ncbi:MAG TPA: ComF family protein [Tepidisphaeraceae bacterium]|jgi:ComF family protein
MGILGHLQHIVDFCYPRICAVCDGVGTDHTLLCNVCMADLQRLEVAGSCRKCAMPLAERGAPCPYCSGKGAAPFERIVALGAYRDPLRHLLLQVKYHNRWPLAELLADRLIKQERAKALLSQTDVLVPVPLHPWRQMSRGYNQAELIARRLAKKCRIRFSRALVRVKNTETQTHIHAKDKRYENLRDAFGLMRRRPIRGKHIVIVDDVYTTGATLTWAARTIQEANPASISAMVIAIADPRGKDFEAI